MHISFVDLMKRLLTKTVTPILDVDVTLTNKSANDKNRLRISMLGRKMPGLNSHRQQL